ncbi:MAG: hypothetical protein ACOYBR_10245 [Fluviibacter sp.]
MSEHLRLLQEMFPGKIYLDEHEVAGLFGLAVKTLIQKRYLRKLPFKVCSISSKFRVSIVELARYMDEDKFRQKPTDTPFGSYEQVPTINRVGRKSRSKLYKGQEIG